MGMTVQEETPYDGMGGLQGRVERAKRAAPPPRKRRPPIPLTAPQREPVAATASDRDQASDSSSDDNRSPAPHPPAAEAPAAEEAPSVAEPAPTEETPVAPGETTPVPTAAEAGPADTHADEEDTSAAGQQPADVEAGATTGAETSPAPEEDDADSEKPAPRVAARASRTGRSGTPRSRGRQSDVKQQAREELLDSLVDAKTTQLGVRIRAPLYDLLADLTYTLRREGLIQRPTQVELVELAFVLLADYEVSEIGDLVRELRTRAGRYRI